MTNYREILRLHNQGLSGRSIASTCECSRNTVALTLKRAREADISWPLPDGLSEADLIKLLFPERNLPSNRKKPDYEYVHKEMSKSGVTLSLLWNEYCEQCRQAQEMPLMYSQFCKHYRDYANVHKATMHINRKPGEQMEVDWAGQTAFLVDSDTGERIPAYIFVATLPSSQYAYVEAFLSQNQECWTTAHIHAYAFFGGVTKVLIPDNLKTGVEKASWYTPTINKTYHELAEHYGTVVLPARVRKPKDKASVEGTVGIISTWIIASLRNQQFFSLVELNEAIHNKLNEFNEKPFQKKSGSRLSVFLEEEKPFLLPLPTKPYELATWRVATVQFNYHITVDKMHYSVPYEYIKHKVDVRLTSRVLEVFFNNHRICSHPRLHGKDGQYSTLVDHMPLEHQKYTTWNAERFETWAAKLGPNTSVVVKTILTQHRVEQQGYRSCMALLKLADKYSAERVESACKKALSYTPQPSYKSIQTILKTGQDRVIEEKPTTTTQSTSQYGFVRGPEYYGRKS